MTPWEFMAIYNAWVAQQQGQVTPPPTVDVHDALMAKHA